MRVWKGPRQASIEGGGCILVEWSGKASDEMTLERKLACPTGMVSLPSGFLLHLEQHPGSLLASLPLPFCSTLPLLWLPCCLSFPQTLQAHSLSLFRPPEGPAPHVFAQQMPAQKDSQVTAWHLSPSDRFLSVSVSPYLECACISETCLVHCFLEQFLAHKWTFDKHLLSS